jgi:hypothetical protein
MADSNYVSGLGARRAPSAVGMSYIGEIQKAGEKFAGAATGLVEAKMEVARREAEARSRVREADFTNDEATKSMFAADALELKSKISGYGDAYDFSNLDDIARFEKDLGVLNKELDDAEVVYNEAIKNFKQLEEEHDLFMKVGEDPNQAITTKVPGLGEVYNSKAGSMEFNLAMGESAFMRDTTVEKTADGKYVMKDQDGQIVKEYANKQEYFADFVALSKPDMKPVPVLTGREKVIKEKWGALYDTEAKAESAFVEYVLNNPEATRRRAQEKADAPGSDFRRSFTNPAAQRLIDKHPTSSRGFDQMSDDQYDYVQEMLQEWRDERKRLKQDTSGRSGGGASDLLTISPSFREMSTFSDAPLDTQGQTLGAEAMGGSATISLGKDLPIRIETKDAETGDVQPMRLVKVRSIGRDQYGPFGFGYYEDEDGNERTVRVPLPADAFGVAPGGLIDEIKQEFDMSPQQYKQLLGNLFTAWDSRYGAGK